MLITYLTSDSGFLSTGFCQRSKYSIFCICDLPNSEGGFSTFLDYNKPRTGKYSIVLSNHGLNKFKIADLTRTQDGKYRYFSQNCGYDLDQYCTIEIQRNGTTLLSGKFKRSFHDFS